MPVRRGRSQSIAYVKPFDSFESSRGEIAFATRNVYDVRFGKGPDYEMVQTFTVID